MKELKIKEDPRNYRQHSERNPELIDKSLAECGAGRSIVTLSRVEAARPARGYIHVLREMFAEKRELLYGVHRK